MAKDKPVKKEPAKSQKERFKEVAKAIGTDESENALDKAFSRLNPQAKREDSQSR